MMWFHVLIQVDLWVILCWLYSKPEPVIHLVLPLLPSRISQNFHSFFLFCFDAVTYYSSIILFASMIMMSTVYLVGDKWVFLEKWLILPENQWHSQTQAYYGLCSTINFPGPTISSSARVMWFYNKLLQILHYYSISVCMQYLSMNTLWLAKYIRSLSTYKIY